jgi:uncharacterized protein (TIGR03067 family)
MRTSLVIFAGTLVVASLGSVVAQTPEERREREHQKLSGVWRVTGVEADGKRLPPAEVPSLRLTFKDRQYTVQLGREKPQGGTYKLDPSKSPKTIDISRTTGPDKGKKQLGIYELIGNSLKICACEQGHERPTNFDTTEKPGYTVLILRRMPDAH